MKQPTNAEYRERIAVLEQALSRIREKVNHGRVGRYGSTVEEDIDEIAADALGAPLPRGAGSRQVAR